MRVKFLTGAHGPDLNCDADKVIDLPDEKARFFLEAGVAVAVDAPVETDDAETETDHETEKPAPVRRKK